MRFVKDNPVILMTGVILICIACQTANCQEAAVARTDIEKLCAWRMHGRGFVKNGDRHAAEFIRHEWKEAGLKSLGNNFSQYFRLNINTFPGAMNIRINDHLLVPGKDFIVDPASPGLSGDFVPVTVKISEALGGKAEALLKQSAGKVMILDTRSQKPEKTESRKECNAWIEKSVYSNPYGLKALIEITGDRLTFGASPGISAIPRIIISAGAYSDSISQVHIDIRNRLLAARETQNMIGYVPGTSSPDSFLVFTAHYDHLGMMGKKTRFPGANDNASGVAMLLGLSRYYVSHPQRFSVVFMIFSGEESGLKGSAYFAENPLISLQAVKFLINLDIVGTGIDGITVVNATEFKSFFNKLTELNDRDHFIAGIKKRGTACNSDHCPFFSKGIPCFFIYTLGGIAAYHDVYDRPDTLPLTAFEGLTRLLIAFAGTF